MPQVGKLGRKKADPARLRRVLTLELTGVLPVVPLTSDHLSLVVRWLLGANDRFGTCGPTSVANFVKMVWKYCLGENISVSDDAVFDLYRRSGNPNFDPNAEPDADGNVPNDEGVDMTVMLDALAKGGIEITHEDGTKEVVKPICYAKVGLDIKTRKAITSIFGGALWGVDLEIAQQSQDIWDYVATPQWGGHAVMGASYLNPAGAHEEDEDLISWATRIGSTDAFTAVQLSEAYVVVFRPTWDHPAFQVGIDQIALAAAYKSCTGRDFPVPVVPPPIPGPGPDPKPTPTDGGWGCLVAGITVAAMAYHLAHPSSSYAVAVKTAINVAKIAAAALGQQ
jgi:hypothetical protein